MKRLRDWYNNHYFLVGLISAAVIIALSFVCLFRFHNSWLFAILQAVGLAWGFKHIPVEVL